MRNVQFLNRVVPTLAILTIGSVATFALPTASYAAWCRAAPGIGGPDVQSREDGSCPADYMQITKDNPRAIVPGPSGVALPDNNDSNTGPGGSGPSGAGTGNATNGGSSGNK